MNFFVSLSLAVGSLSSRAVLSADVERSVLLISIAVFVSYSSLSCTCMDIIASLADIEFVAELIL